eukprot:CAMPEP_0117609270 /NCGR_PEP_ID=MMETSP0784-20121206/81243_1 /TAXON_ID=39447 /ORGANISM="" /LENGTH=73 /DNA_ID=CAMNT_0005412581 /DNA_START=87 /DNA_END=308 /DNA_ORIENTATION=-
MSFHSSGDRRALKQALSKQLVPSSSRKLGSPLRSSKAWTSSGVCCEIVPTSSKICKLDALLNALVSNAPRWLS